jgi:hypothetical protein
MPGENSLRHQRGASPLPVALALAAVSAATELAEGYWAGFDLQSEEKKTSPKTDAATGQAGDATAPPRGRTPGWKRSDCAGSLKLLCSTEKSSFS